MTFTCWVYWIFFPDKILFESERLACWMLILILSDCGSARNARQGLTRYPQHYDWYTITVNQLPALLPLQPSENIFYRVHLWHWCDNAARKPCPEVSGNITRSLCRLSHKLSWLHLKLATWLDSLFYRPLLTRLSTQYWFWFSTPYLNTARHMIMKCRWLIFWCIHLMLCSPDLDSILWAQFIIYQNHPQLGSVMSCNC